MAKKAATAEPEAGIAEGGTDDRQELVDALQNFSWDDPIEEKKEPEQAGEQSAPPEGTSIDWGELFADLKTPDEVDAFLAKIPSDVLDQSSFLREEKRKAEQRGRTTAREAEDAQQRQQQAYQGFLQQAARAAQTLDESIDEVRRKLQKYDPDDPDDAKSRFESVKSLIGSDDFDRNLKTYVNGMWLAGAQKATDSLRSWVDEKAKELLTDIPPESAARLDQARRIDAQQGSLTELSLKLELLIEQASERGKKDGEKEGYKRAEGELKLLERFENFRRLKGQLPPPTPNGTGANLQSDEIIRQYNAGEMDSRTFNEHLKAGRVDLSFKG